LPFARLRDIDVHYELRGEGRPVLFINGTGRDLRQKPSVFDGPLGRADDLAVLAYDQRGLGQSSKPDVAYSMADYADDAAALIEHVGWRSCAVIGVSFGGMVAQELAIRHPRLVDRLVLCCTSSGGAGGSSYPLHELADLEPRERARRQVSLSDVRLEVTDALVDMALATASVGQGEPGREVGARRQLEARAEHDTWDRLPTVTAATLVCAGRYDGIAPVERSEALADRIPDAELAVFEGGHLFLIQDRSSWQHIIEFVREESDAAVAQSS
jgi:3-oxoadipate enol-lactonase